MSHAVSDRLKALEAQLTHELALLNLPAKPWVPARLVDGQRVLDVAVVGAGMLGLVTLAALGNAGIENAIAFDRAIEGREGPWITSARMETLRTRKEAVGPALGIPSLTFRAWFEAQYGAEAFERMERIPREMWMAYLVWYRRTLALPVRNGTTVTRVELRADGLVSLGLLAADGTKRCWRGGR